MARRIIIFGATGFTGRLLAQRLASQGATPVLAGRSEASLRELAEPLGLEWQVADALRQNSVFALLEPGDVLVSTVGPFVKWGEPAVRAAVAARSVYIDSTGEPSVHPPRLRRVRPARRARGRGAAAGHGLRLRAGHAGRRAGARGGRRGRGARGRRLLRLRGRHQRRDAPLGGRDHARGRLRPPRRRAADRRGSPSACARSTSAARTATPCRSAAPSTSRCRPSIRGSRRSTSTSAGSARWPGRCRPAAWPARSRCACPACAGC